MTDGDGDTRDVHLVVADHFEQDKARWREEYERADFDSRRYQLRARDALEMLDSLHTPGGRLLDVGTGAGLQAAAAYRRGWAVAGMDLTPAMVKQAATEHEGPAWVVGSAEAPPFGDATFDVVMMLGLIGYVSDAERTLGEVRRTLRPGGHLIVTWHNRETLLGLTSRATTYVPRKVSRAFRRWRRGADTEGPAGEESWGFYAHHNRHWSGNAFNQLLKQAGFVPLRETAMDFGRLRPFGLKLWAEGVDIRLSRSLESLARTSVFGFLRHGAMMHVVLARAPAIREA